MLWPHCAVCGLIPPQASVWLQIDELQTGELHTGVGGWMMVELMFLPIIARATHVQRETVVALPFFIVRLLCITSTHTESLMFPDWDIVTLYTHIINRSALTASNSRVRNLYTSHSASAFAVSISVTAVRWGFVGRPENLMEFWRCFVLYKFPLLSSWN